ncbi:MAG: exonuclease SbcCD subunit D [Candidatus Bipolaricaulia bacterium]
MELIHFSDTHLGYREFHRVDSDTGINQREQDVYDAFRSVIDKILALDPDLVIHAGDLFDKVRPTNRAVNLATEQFARLSEAGIPTVLIAGNHDTPKISTTGTITRALDRLANIEAVTSDLELNGSGYRKIPVGRTLVHAVSDAPTEDKLAESIEVLEPEESYRWNILVIHAGISTLEDEVFSGEFNEHYLNKGILDDLGFDYVALGHYHKRMEIELSSPAKAMYPGAPERFSFNESDYEPGFLHVHFDEEGIRCEEKLLETRNFINLGSINGEDLTVNEIQQEIEDRLPADGEIAGSLISLKIRGVDENAISMLEESCLEGLREKSFETNFQLISTDEFGETGTSLAFADLRTEFSDFMENRAEISEELDSDRLIETGQKYLSLALDEEDDS